MQWVNRLTRAVEENRLLLYRQRIVSIADPAGPEEHYEILIRLRGENDEIIPPGAFISRGRALWPDVRVDRCGAYLFAANGLSRWGAACLEGTSVPMPSICRVLH